MKKQFSIVVITIIGLLLIDQIIKIWIKNYGGTYKIIESRKGDRLDEYLIGMKRIHSVIQQWEELLMKQGSINKYKDTFMSLINDLLQRKN